MIYVFDTSSLSNLKHFYPQVFTSIWQELDLMVQAGELISTKEVWNEMQRGNAAQHTNAWLKLRKQMFTTPGPDELRFVAEILAIPHFQALIGERQRLMGTPVADPFVIACAKVKGVPLSQRNNSSRMRQRFRTFVPTSRSLVRTSSSSCDSKGGSFSIPGGPV